MVGGQIGYRWQAGQFVFGLEAQGDWANLRNSNQSLFFTNAFGLPDTWTTKTTAFGLFTGQVGYAWNNVLWYVKGGAAVANQNWTLDKHVRRQTGPVGAGRLVLASNTVSHRIGPSLLSTTISGE